MALSRFSIPSISALVFSALALAAFPRAASAQAQVLFTGGSGTRLSMTITAPVTYTVTTQNIFSPVFTFDAVGSYFSTASGYSCTGNLTYTINRGSGGTMTGIEAGFNGGDTTGDDFSVFDGNALRTVNLGDVIVLNPGTVTTNTGFAGVAPRSGSYTTFLTTLNGGGRISGNGTPLVVAPEPGTFSLLGMGLMTGLGMVGMVKRRKAAKRID